MAVGSSGTGSGSQRGMRSGAAAARQRGSYAGTQRTQDPTYILLADEKASRILPCELVLGRHAGVAEVVLRKRTHCLRPSLATPKNQAASRVPRSRVFISDDISDDITTLNIRTCAQESAMKEGKTPEPKHRWRQHQPRARGAWPRGGA